MNQGALEIGDLLGKYQIVRLLGEGGMGAVYEAVNTALAKRVAIKVLLPEVARMSEPRARFLREGQVASRISHTHVVEVFDVGEDRGIPFIVMEYLEGCSLATRLVSGLLPLAAAVDILVPIGAAVAAGHDAGVVHRDLKPSNVFLSVGRMGDPVPKVLDFGVSKVMTSDGNDALTGTAAVLGTAAYMSPEQASGARNVGPASDQYSLALIAHEALTGRRVHEGDNPLAIIHQIVNGRITSPRSLNPNIPAEVEAAIVRALSREPDRRFSSVRDFVRAILPFASPEVRAIWTNRLGQADDRAAASWQAQPQRSAPPISVEAGGTQILPDGIAPHPVAVPATTTLRGATSEVAARPSAAGATRGRGRIVATAGGALLAAGLAFFLLLRFSEKRPELPLPAAERSAGAAAPTAPSEAPSALVGAGEKVAGTAPLAVKGSAADVAAGTSEVAPKEDPLPPRAATDGGAARISETAVRTQSVQRGTVKKIRKKMPDRKRNEDIF